jgi:hypothetical protein
VAVGQFKRGKSSVINALLGRPLLPVGVIPLTSVVTVLRYGAVPSLTVVFESADPQTVPLDELAEYVTEKGNPKNCKHVREVQIDYPSAWLENGVRLVDTPGIGSAYDHNNDMTMQYVPQADAVLFVGSVDQPLSRAELDLLEAIRPYAQKIFFLMNKIDYLNAEELRESLHFSTQVLQQAMGRPTPIYAVSARFALQEKQGLLEDRSAAAGFRAFEAQLLHFTASDKPAAWLQSMRQGLLRILAQLRFLTHLEIEALDSPMEIIRRNLHAFEEMKRQTLRQKLDYEVLLKADLDRLMVGDLQSNLEHFKGVQKERIPTQVIEWARARRSLTSRQLTQDLEQQTLAEVRLAYDGWIQAQEPRVAQSFTALTARFSSSIHGTIEKLSREAAALFRVPFTPGEYGPPRVTESEFRYKYWHEPVGLQILTSTLVLALPNAIGHLLIAKRMRRRAADLVEMQAGRIRHDWSQRLEKSCQLFRQQLVAQIDAVIMGIESAIERAIAIRSQGEAEAATRGHGLARKLEQADTIERRALAAVKAPQE